MNISANPLPISAITTPLKAEVFSQSNLPDGPSLAVTTNPAPDPISGSPASRTVNPTYNKPISSPVIEGESDQTGRKAINQVIKLTPDEEPNVGEHTEVKPPAFEPPQNEGIYSEAELELISSLKLRDAEVGAHERAHASVGGQHASSPSYSYKTGPDGVKYAVSGEVSIDTSRIPGDPQATLQKAQQIKSAALAPTTPSGQDRKVAAKADQMASEARSDLLEVNRQGNNKRVSSSLPEYRSSEHFNGQQNLSIDNRLDSTVQTQMSERSFHINALYQNSASTILPPSFEAQA